MIWHEANPGADIYFTDTLNGNRTNMYDSMVSEINNLVNSYNTLPAINNSEVYIYTNKETTLDCGEVTKYFKTDEEDIRIEGRKIIVNNLPVGDYHFTMYREESNYNKPIIFYQSSNSQNMIETGDLDKQVVNFNAHVVNPTITVKKEDEETGNNPQGEASLDGAIITLYDIFHNKIRDYTVENGQTVIENLTFNAYYIKETKPGLGYQLNNEEVKIWLSENNYNQEITIKNKVIEKELKIIKNYGTENEMQREKDISFDIYNSNNELIKTITTNEFGEASTTLPYGSYNIIQYNTTSGYAPTSPFQIIVNDTTEEIIELKDYKIPVPDTSSNKKNNYLLLILFILIILK